MEIVEESITENMEEIEAKRNAELAQAWTKLNRDELSEQETYTNH
jgi:hypothetical protein